MKNGGLPHIWPLSLHKPRAELYRGRPGARLNQVLISRLTGKVAASTSVARLIALVEIAPESQEQFGDSDHDENHASKSNCDPRSTVARRGSNGPQFAVQTRFAHLSTKKPLQFDSATLVKLRDFVKIRQKQSTSHQVNSAEKETVVEH